MECSKYYNSSIPSELENLYARLQRINFQAERCQDISHSVENAEENVKEIRQIISSTLKGRALRFAEQKLNDYIGILNVFKSDSQEQQEEKAAPEETSNQVQEIAQRVQETQTRNILTQDDPTIPALHAAALKGNCDWITDLLAPQAGQAQMDVNMRDAFGNTPLHIAAGANQLDAMKLLLKNGANIHSANLNGLTPLHLAMRHGASDCFEHLLQESIKSDSLKNAIQACNNKRISLIHLAVRYNRPEILKTVLETYKIAIDDTWLNSEDDWEQTALHYAVIANHVECAKLLITFGMNINKKDATLMTPILSAAAAGRIECVRWLINQKNTDLTVKNTQNRNIIHLLVKNRNLPRDVIDLLQKKIPQETWEQMINAPDNQNITPLQIAESTNQALYSYLIECGAKERALNIQEVTCKICEKIFNRPILLACGHTFCEPCLYFQAKEIKDNCMTCKRNLRILPKDFILSKVLKKNFEAQLEKRREEDDKNSKLHALIRSLENIEVLGEALDNDDIRLDLKNNSVMLEINELRMRMHITHLPQKQELFVFSPILALPTNPRILTRLYWTLLEFGPSGIRHTLSGFGIEQNQLFVHIGLPMLHAPNHTLRDLYSPYIELIKKWKKFMEALTQWGLDANFLEEWIKIRDQLAKERELSPEEQGKLKEKLIELGELGPLIKLADEIQNTTYPQLLPYCEEDILKENIKALTQHSIEGGAAYHVKEMPPQGGMETYLIRPHGNETLTMTASLDVKSGCIRLSCVIIKDYDIMANDDHQQKKFLEQLLSASVFGFRTAGGVLTREKSGPHSYDIILQTPLKILKSVQQDDQWRWDITALTQFLPTFIECVNFLKEQKDKTGVPEG